MSSITFDNSSCNIFDDSNHISSLLTSFQDKNSHLFPSTDLSFENISDNLEENSIQNLCGKKRKRDSLYDSFSNWNEELLSNDSLSYINNDNDLLYISEDIKIKNENDKHISKKRKLSSDDVSVLLSSDACSRSPPFQALSPIEQEIITIKEEIKKLENIPKKQDNTPLSKLLNTISNTDSSICKTMFDSLNSLADRTEKGNNPVWYPSNTAPPHVRIQASQDYLSLQTVFSGISIPSPSVVNTQEQQYIPVTAAGIPFVMQNPYSTNVPVSSVSQKVIPVSYTNPNAIFTSSNSSMGYTNNFVKNSSYSTMLQNQNMYSMQPTVHVL